MPKYLVTSGSHFTPFTYDELVKPVAHMQAAHDAAQDAYDTLNLETSALRNYISDNPEDSQAKAMYDNYMDKLTTLQNNLWEHGYNGQTRRDLSAARSAYASDITRLGKAIQTRQERSKAYWDMRHKNPDLIMGEDPGIAGLNYYLDDDNYGQDYFSYSGQQFMSEVGADAKARAGEMLRDPQVLKNPDLVGYLTTIQQDGFTNQEVQNAGNAVRAAVAGNSAALDALDPASRILADVLMSHLNSTGAQGKVSADEYNRLLGYGISGLSQGVGKTDVRQVNDKMWDYNRQMAVANAGRSGGSGGGDRRGRNDDEEQFDFGYDLNELKLYLESPTAKKDIKAVNKQFLNLARNPKTVIGNDGTPYVVRTSADAENVLNSVGRQEFIDKWGFSPEEDPVGKEVSIRTPDGNVIKGTISRKSKSPRVVPSGTGAQAYNLSSDENTLYIGFPRHSGVRDSSLVKELNDDLNAYNKRVRDLSKANGVDVQKLATTDVDRGRFKSKNNVPQNVPWDKVAAFLANRAEIGLIIPATIASAGPYMEKYKELLGANILASYNANAHMNSKGRLKDLTDKWGFYRIDKETGAVSKRAERELPLNSAKDIGYALAVPEYLVNEGKIVVGIGNTNYAIDPDALGGSTAAQVNKLRGPISLLMKPIMDPNSAWEMSEQEKADWAILADRLLHRYRRFVQPTQNPDGTNGYWLYDPTDLTVDEAEKQDIRRIITMYMNDLISEGRDYSNEHHFTPLGNSDSHVRSYYNYNGN